MIENVFILPNEKNPVQDKKVKYSVSLEEGSEPKYNSLLIELKKFDYESLNEEDDFVIEFNSEELTFKFFRFDITKRCAIVIALDDINKYFN